MGVEFLGKTFDKILGISGGEGAPKFLLGGRSLCDEEVVPDGAVEEKLSCVTYPICDRKKRFPKSRIS